MWFIFITACLFISLSFQPRLAASLLRSCSVVNSPIRQAGLSPAFRPLSLAQHLCPSVVDSGLLCVLRALCVRLFSHISVHLFICA